MKYTSLYLVDSSPSSGALSTSVFLGGVTLRADDGQVDINPRECSLAPWSTLYLPEVDMAHDICKYVCTRVTAEVERGEIPCKITSLLLSKE